jgi:hypothetical protein
VAGMSLVSIRGSSLGTTLQSFLTCDDIQPGAEPSYEICKVIYLYHPLGKKMAEAPITLAQSQSRTISVQGAPDDIKEEFEAVWGRIGADKVIFNVKRQSRIYGVSSLALLADGVPTDRPLNPRELPGLRLSFNVFDPLNTAGSLVLSQMPNAFDFQKSVNGIKVQGTDYHPSRCVVVMNEEPIYIAYTVSAFGYVGRSVFQRALFPLKTFVQGMRTDDMIERKVGLLVAMMDAGGSIIDNVMQTIQGIKRNLLKEAETDNVLSIGKDDKIESLNLQNLDGPHELARKNSLKNIATAADMPAVLLENETLTEGFGEGTEDAKSIAKYIDSFRKEMAPLYDWMTPIVQRLAWTPEFFDRMAKKYPDLYGPGSKCPTHQIAFYQWQNDFAAAWPNYLEEPDSEKSKAEDVKLKAVIALVETLAPQLDPENKGNLIAWAVASLNENKTMFKTELEFDEDDFRAWTPPDSAQKEDEDETEEVQPPRPFAATA